MKLLGITFFLLSIFHCAFGQVSPTDSAAVYEQTTWEKYNIKYNNPIYVVDGKPIDDSLSKKVLNAMEPYAIIKIACLHSSSPAKRNVVYITTAMVKIAAYQKKISEFSPAYKNYLNSHQNKDGRIFYILNNNTMQGDRRDITEELYNIPVDKIERVYFNSEKVMTGSEATLVSITTK